MKPKIAGSFNSWLNCDRPILRRGGGCDDRAGCLGGVGMTHRHLEISEFTAQFENPSVQPYFVRKRLLHVWDCIEHPGEEQLVYLSVVSGR